MKSIELRKVAISHLKNGKKPAEIWKMLAKKVHLSTIFRWTSRFQKIGNVLPLKSNGRPRSARTKKLVNLVKNRLKLNNTRKSLRTIAKDFNSSQQTIRRVLRYDLAKKCYKKTKVQKLKPDHKSKRKSCCTWMRKNINIQDFQRFMFIDEKIFTNNGYLNPKNDVVWADSRSAANKEFGKFGEEKIQHQ